MIVRRPGDEFAIDADLSALQMHFIDDIIEASHVGDSEKMWSIMARFQENGQGKDVFALVGRAFQKKKKYEQAIEFYKRQIHARPDFTQARSWLSECYDELRKLDPDRPVSISVCMIMRDEEKNIQSCLKSIRKIADEIIIYDTGSVDSSTDIALEWGAQVVMGMWEKDFSASRNQSLKRATSEWILVIDADEFISESDAEKIPYFLRHCESPLVGVKQTNYLKQTNQLGWHANKLGVLDHRRYPGYVEINVVRIMRNRPDIFYQGVVHEHPISLNENCSVLDSDIRIHHLGKMQDINILKRKSFHYEELGRVKIGRDPNNPAAFYELGVQLIENGNLQEGKDYLEQAIKMDSNYARAWFHLANVNLLLGHYESTLANLEHCEKLSSNDPLTVLLKLSGLVALGKISQAQTLIDDKVTSQLKDNAAYWLNRAILAEKKNNRSDSKKYLQISLDLDPSYTPSLTYMASKLIQDGDCLGAARILDQILSGLQFPPQALRLRGEVAFRLGKAEQAISFLEKAYTQDTKDLATVYLLIVTNHYLGNLKAVKEYEKILFSDENKKRSDQYCHALKLFYEEMDVLSKKKKDKSKAKDNHAR